MPDHSAAKVERIRIDRIQVGERRRQHLGPVAQLAKDIEEHGLLHPIVVTDDLVLVCGSRRLRACEKLGWKSIPARRFGDLSLDELHALELSENVHRLDLTTYEQNRELVERAEAESGEKLRPDAEVSRGGRGKQGGNAKAARAVGVDERTIRRARKHVSAGQTYPFLQARGWRQGQALEVSERLDKMPEPVRAAVVEMCEEPGVPPTSQATIIENVAEMEREAQREWAKLAKAEDESKRSLAKTRAVRQPPEPPPGLHLITDAIRSCERALQYSDTEEKAAVRSAISSLREAFKATESAYKALRKQEGF